MYGLVLRLQHKMSQKTLQTINNKNEFKNKLLQKITNPF